LPPSVLVPQRRAGADPTAPEHAKWLIAAAGHLD
jgi:hypothetical protein